MSEEGTPTTREDVYGALFAFADKIRWRGASGQSAFVEKHRRVKLWDDIAGQPALCQAEHQEVIQQTTALVYKRTFKASWIIYHTAGRDDPGAIPATETNAILDAVQAAFTPDGPEDLQTLGGLVHHAWIDGAIDKFQGDLDGQTMIVVPISMFVP